MDYDNNVYIYAHDLATRFYQKIDEVPQNTFMYIEKIDATDDNDNVITFATYEYNLMGSMIKSTDAKNNAIKVEYDLMGRRIKLESPDSGVQITHYNTTTGQLDYTQNSVLIEKGQKIVYQYDEFGRLKKIVYPDNKQLDNTEYEYDENDQIVKKIDNSGEHYYQYGKLGEIVSETIKLKQQTGTIDQQQYHEATFSYKHNYLGQMEEITYPSGEIVKYSYTNGGNVCQVTGKMKFEASDHTFKYVNNITYDKKDRRTSIEYGNGVKSLYEYDEARGWLTRLVTTDRLDRKIQNIEYRFDVTGNVISYTNDCDTFNTTQEYQYDVLGQLIEVNGKSICNKYSSGPEYVADYTQTWKFDNIGRVEKKTSNAVCPLKNDLGGDLLSYSFDYTYIEGKANQVGSCTGRYYAYDANGNMTIEQNVPIETETTGYIATVTQVKDDAYYVDQAWGVENDKQTAVSGISRRIFEYNCKNEMIVSKDSNYYTKYIYNQEGQRTSKYSSLGESLYFNEYASWTKRSGDSGNPDGRDAMHIYINGQRIVTKQNSATRYELSDQINKQYWYHTNHIGNVDVITERDGNQFERFEYTPYGETWIHHDSLYLNNSNLGIFGDSIDIKYRFTGKEKDEETGYTYFGARYLDSKRGIWTQTDPALGDYIPTAGTTLDKLPGMGGIYNLVNSQLYHYAGNNPVKYTDPDGNSSFWDDSIKGFQLTFNVLQNVGNTKAATDFSEFMNTTPEFWIVLGITGSLIGTGYLCYNNIEGLKSFVDDSIAWCSDANQFFLDKGLDIQKRTFTYKQDTGFMIKVDFSKIGFSGESFTLGSDNIFSLPIDRYSSVEAKLNYFLNISFKDIKNDSKLNQFDISLGMVYKF